MAKATSMVLIRAALLVLALSVYRSEGHNKSQPSQPTNADKSQPTNAGKANLDVNLNGAFHTVFAFGESGTDTGNARLMGTLQNFVGSWLHAMHGGMAVDGGGGAGGSISGGGGAGGGGGVGGSISFGGGGGASFSGSVSGSGGGSGSGGLSLIGNGLTNGKLVIEHICEALGIPHVPPFKDQNANFSNGANFALAGSSALPGSMFLHNRDSILSLMWKAAPHSFDTQLQWFNQFMQNHQHKPDMNKTLFWLGGVGSNDYARIHRASGFSGEWITQHAIEEAVELLHGMVKQGAKYIMVQGLPPLGCLPVDLLLSPIGERDQYGCGARTNKAVMNHNEMLQQKLGELQKQFPHCVIIYADMWKAFMKVLAGFHQFGFVEPFKACCGSGGGHFNFDLKHLCGSPHASVCAKAAEHMIWDGIHFSAKLNKVLAKLFLAGGFTHPPLKKVIKLNLHLLHHLI